MAHKRHTPYGVGFTHNIRERILTARSFNQDRYHRLLAQAFARILASGGEVWEHHYHRGPSKWRVGSNCFVEPTKSNPQRLGEHLAKRFTGFGFPVTLHR